MRNVLLSSRPEDRANVPLWVFFAGLLLSSPVAPATITVDEVACTLVDAIEAANDDTEVGGCTAGDPGLDTIELVADVFISEPNSNYFGETAFPTVRSEITIDGGGRGITASEAGRVFAVVPSEVPSMLTLRSTTITGGELSFGDGAGIFVGVGTSLRVLNSSVTANEAFFLNDELVICNAECVNDAINSDCAFGNTGVESVACEVVQPINI